MIDYARERSPRNSIAVDVPAGKVLILAPNDGNIWAASPFCAVPSGFRVSAGSGAWMSNARIAT